MPIISKVRNVFSLFSFIANHPLNRKHKVASIRNFFAWQVGSRLVPGPVVVNFVNDSKLLVKPGMTGATLNIYTGLHEFEDMSFVLHALRKNDVFVDVGANVGTYTVLAGAAIGAQCITFEPAPSTFSNLMRNVDLNQINNLVDARNVGVGETDGEITFTSGLDTVNHVLSKDEHHADAVTIPVVTLDKSLQGSNPVVIKIDVEGFETSVISGAANVLSQESLLAIVMELNGSGNRYGFDEAQLHKKILDYGFQSYRYDPFKRKLISLKGKNFDGGNTIYVKNLDALTQRLESAPKFKVKGQSI
ncbi:FkbM family methyltransferase [bacterium]|nr:MAG: FkbM family methyltransferase [bacterium]